jgi:hypothetical protein
MGVASKYTDRSTQDGEKAATLVSRKPDNRDPKPSRTVEGEKGRRE